MRTILFVLFSFILIIAFQQCNKNEFSISPNNSIKITNDTIIYDDVKCLPCCNRKRPDNCNQYPFPPGISLAVGNPAHDICITCPCCIDIWDYYGGTLPPPEQIPENIVNIVGCDETIIEH